MQDLRFFLKPRYANSRALIIGVDKYKYAPPLSYAVADAETIRDLLVTNFEFPEENISCLIDSEATKQNILRSFLGFSADDVEFDDRILVFFAGHGYTKSGIRGEVGYLVSHDSDMRDLSTMVRWNELTQDSELVRAKHLLFIMDACYGGLALTRSLQPGSTRFVNDMLLRYSRQVLTAGKADEVVADSGGPLPNHSIFTGHLINGLMGDASVNDGIITANGLMAYVYSKVANDKNSRQTPHYGYFDGDGDFVLKAPNLFAQNDPGNKDIDKLVVVPFIDEMHSADSIYAKVGNVKRMLADDKATIELHDFMIVEVKQFISESSEDHFKVQGAFSTDELFERIGKYERISSDLYILLACIAYWGKATHLQTLQKVLARSTDRLQDKSGLTAWLCLRWYPILLEMYFAGIAAVEARRFDSLASIFFTTIDSSRATRRGGIYFVEFVANAILEFNRVNVFKLLPGHERHYAPLSEYLFKLLQPKLDDHLYMGQSYEDAFDEFEVLFALTVADCWKQREGHLWAPIGRFGWKHHNNDSPLARIVSTARSAGGNWAPLRFGFFGADWNRFIAVAEEFSGIVSRLGWF